MGDHRASIKIDIEFHGVKAHQEFWINWVQPMPSTVEEFFEDVYTKGLAVYHDKMDDYFQEQEEIKERELLKTLKDKYEPTPQTLNGKEA